MDKEKPAKAGLDDDRDSAYAAGMTIEELTPEAAALLRSLINNPHEIEGGPLLQLLMADRLVMGSPAQVHVTGAGKRLLMAYVLADSDA